MTTKVLPFTSGNGAVPVKAREIALLGYAEETRGLVDALPADVEIWGINAAHYFLKRPAHVWFQLHPRDWATGGGEPTGYYGRPKEHFEWLRLFEGTLYLLEPNPELPKALLFPRAEICREFGREYLTSTFAYQMALVLYEHLHGRPVGRLYIYGINLTATEEYAHQRPCAEYWLGRLEQAGIQVTIPAASSLLKGPIYPHKGEDLAAHAYTRLQHWKDNYMVAWANANTMLSMQAEGRHWAAWLAGLDERNQGLFVEAIQKEIAEHFKKRQEAFGEMANRYTADMNGANGVTNDCRHFLTMLGGTDFKAARLPNLRVPSVKLEGDFDYDGEPKRI